jgi:4'-phosphopantetheinyl transferase
VRRERPLLRDHEIHVEWLRVDAFLPALVALGETLSEAERARARRFGFARDREVFVVTRAALRAVLGRYLGRPPRDVRFLEGPHGKPALADSDAALRFNVTHSGAIAMLAITRGRRVGIDVEEIRPDFPYLEVAERVFTPGERAALRALPADRRAEAFFRTWTCKEAYVKGRGTGLSLAPDAFSVALPPAEPGLLEVEGEPGEAARWTLVAIPPAAGFAAALAAEGEDWLVRCRQLIPDPRDPTRLQ